MRDLPGDSSPYVLSVSADAKREPREVAVVDMSGNVHLETVDASIHHAYASSIVPGIFCVGYENLDDGNAPVTPFGALTKYASLPADMYKGDMFLFDDLRNPPSVLLLSTARRASDMVLTMTRAIEPIFDGITFATVLAVSIASREALSRGMFPEDVSTDTANGVLDAAEHFRLDDGTYPMELVRTLLDPHTLWIGTALDVYNEHCVA